MAKSCFDKTKELPERIKEKTIDVIGEVKPIYEKTKSYVESGLVAAKNASKKISDQTKIGTAVGGTIGLVAAGTGGMGIVAMGGAVGIPVALVTALVGAGVGSRWGSAVRNEELIKKLELVAEERSATGLNVSEKDEFVERIIGKEAHFRAFYKAIEDATDTLCIRSGWISSSVVDPLLGEKFKAAMDRGVTIYIESGWRKKGDTKSQETEFTLAAKDTLRKLIIYSHQAHENDPKTQVGRIFIADVPTHIKEIVVDSMYYISGSNNWLSNGMHSNKEASHIIRLPQIAREIRDETVLSVRTHLSELHGANA